jgi:vacuolar-type H+-ATPase subunit I/STV1
LLPLVEDLISNTLPETFDSSKVPKAKTDACTYCKKQFGVVRNNRHNCYRCGACVCERCSENKEQLSRSDPKEYRVCNMCFAIRKNKPIIVFYNDLDKAKQTRLEGLQVRKMNYKEQLLKDESEIRSLKRQLEEQKLHADTELEELANELRQLKAEQLSNKESTKSLN